MNSGCNASVILSLRRVQRTISVRCKHIRVDRVRRCRNVARFHEAHALATTQYPRHIHSSRTRPICFSSARLQLHGHLLCVSVDASAGNRLLRSVQPHQRVTCARVRGLGISSRSSSAAHHRGVSNSCGHSTTRGLLLDLHRDICKANTIFIHRPSRTITVSCC